MTSQDLRLGGVQAGGTLNFARGMMQATTAVAGMGILGEEGTANVMKAYSYVSGIAGGIQMLAALNAVIQARSALKTAEGVANLKKYGHPLIMAAVAVAAAAGAYYLAGEIDRRLEYSGDYSGPEGRRLMRSQLQEAAYG